jgi:hypothetical protein
MKTGGRNTRNTRGSVIDKTAMTRSEAQRIINGRVAKLNRSLDCVANDNGCKCSLESLTTP